MGRQNIIELNGRQYDAVTGALLGQSRIQATPATRAVAKHRGRTIDGFIRQPAPQVIKPTSPTQKNEQPPHKHTESLSVTAPKKTTHKRTTVPITAHQPERPKTLMRHVVSKPKTKLKTAIKPTTPTEMMARPTGTLVKQLEKKLSVAQVDPIRLARAKHVAKSHHVRRFERGLHAAQPVPQARPHQAHVAHITPATAALPPRKTSHSHALAKAKQDLAESHVDIFEAALAHAVSHEQKPLPYAKHHRRRMNRGMVNALAGAAAFLIIGGFIAYLNMPGIELRVASLQAGFHAEMPDYRPTGYALEGKVQRSNDKITLRFSSGDSSYQITQQASDWNSATLLDQKTEEQGAPTQTVQSKGRIIYIYDNHATWVNNGVHYEITGNAALDTNELISLATSI